MSSLLSLSSQCVFSNLNTECKGALIRHMLDIVSTRPYSDEARQIVASMGSIREHVRFIFTCKGEKRSCYVESPIVNCMYKKVSEAERSMFSDGLARLYCIVTECSVNTVSVKQEIEVLSSKYKSDGSKIESMSKLYPIADLLAGAVRGSNSHYDSLYREYSSFVPNCLVAAHLWRLQALIEYYFLNRIIVPERLPNSIILNVTETVEVH